MSHLNRVDSGSGGSPSTLRSPLLRVGLKPRQQDPNSDVGSTALNTNTILSNLTHREKLQTLHTIVSRTIGAPHSSLVFCLVSKTTNARKICDDLRSSYGMEARCYSQAASGSGFNYAWFKELGEGLMVAPALAMLLALDRGLVNLAAMSYLIIDDAHSVAMDSPSTPLTTIFLEYYGKLPESRRPRVLGLTHYPLETSFGYVTLHMEQVLDARVSGDLDTRRKQLVKDLTRVTLSILEYPPLRSKDASTPLPGGNHPVFEATISEIGECCVPLLSHFDPDTDVEGIIKGKHFAGLAPPDISAGTSPKFDTFFEYIRIASELPDFRCIIIAHNPFTILALRWLLSANGRSRIRSSIYLGHTAIDYPPRTRESLFSEFVGGSVNTLICTESILSGMDENICSHVIWFNPYSSLIAYTRSRTFARSAETVLLLLAERGNRNHYRATRDVLHMEPSVTSWMLSMGTDGAPIPPIFMAHCPRFSAPPIILSPSRGSTQENPYLLNPVSGSRIYLQDSEEALYRFLATQTNNRAAMLPIKIFSYDRTVGGGRSAWRCTINVPLCTPPLNVSGELSSCKALARGSACFCACSTLFDLNLLDSSLFPPRPQHTQGHGILQPSKISGTPGHYPFVFPLFWHNCLLAAPSKAFHPSVVSFLPVSGSGTLKSMILLTRLPLRDMQEFSLFSSQVEIKVALNQYKSLALNAERLELIFRYTVHLLRILCNKPFDAPSGELAYFVIPVRPDSDLVSDDTTHTSVEPFISWDEIGDLVSSRVRPLNCSSADEMSLDLLAGVIQDRANEFTRRFEDGKLRKDLNPLSATMREQPHGPHISLLDYYRTHRHEFEGIKNLQQPLIEATLLPGLSNQLDPKDTPVEPSKNFLVPEMCYVSSIPAPTFRTALLMPSVIWHIENVLIAKELNLTLFQGQIRDDLLMHALCSQTARRTFNYERLEFLGDTFIKYAASAYLYGTQSDATAGLLHSKRQRMVNNRTLWQGANAIGLPACIQSEPFRPKQWAIPNVSITKRAQGAATVDPEHIERANAKLFSRQIVPKAIADVVEAIVGAALLSGGEKLAFSVAKILGFDVPKTCDWFDVVSYTPCKVVTPQEAREKETLEGIMKIIGVSLDNPKLLVQAVHHPSLTSLSRSYERLEFLGDAILDMLVVQSFFSDEEKWSPHNMTLIKSSMVSNRALAIICVESGLHRFLMHDAPHLTKSIKAFVEEIEACKNRAKTDAQRLKYWSTLQAPKALGDVVESLLGAIYVSCGFSLSRVKVVYDRLLKPFYDQYIDKKAMLSHPMAHLMKKLESAGCRALGITKSSMPASTGNGFITKCEVKVHGRVIADATSERPKKAITLATEEALFSFESKFDSIMSDCTCKNTSQGKKRKRAPVEEDEISEPLAGDDAEHPIDVDMFDF